MARWSAVSACFARRRSLRFSLTVGIALASWGVVQAASERHLDDAFLTLGAALQHALHVERDAPVVDWEALEREIAPSEPATSADAPTVEMRATLDERSDKTKAPKKTSAALNTIVVSADQVLRLSKVARVPASRYVPPQGARPAGLQVAGVSGLGIGVRDGDVLTHVAGAEVQSSASVISTVLRLRAQQAPAISGEVWRGQERYRVVFQMPYMTPSPASSGSGANSLGFNSAPNAAEPSTIARN